MRSFPVSLWRRVGRPWPAAGSGALTIAVPRATVGWHKPFFFDAVEVLHSICQQSWKIQQWPQDWKRSVLIAITKKGNAKECSNYRTIAFISHTSIVMLKILKARLQLYVNRELPDVQAGFRKGIKLPTSAGSWKKQESSRKTSISALLTMPKPLTVWITINCGKFFERWEYQTT